MPFKVRLRLLLRGLPKLIAAIVIAGVIGVGLGVLLSALSGNDDDSGGLADTSTTRTHAEQRTSTTRKQTKKRTTTTKTTPARTRTSTTKTTVAPPPPAASNVRVQIVTAFLQRASTASGRSRNRARISVHVRVTNRGRGRIARSIPVLIATGPIRPDPAAKDTTGTLLKSIASGETAGGRLRFETGGADTTALAKTLRARLRIAGRTVVVKLKLGRPPS